MTFMHELADVFDEAFKIYEQNRMYPPGYGKEPLMKKLTLEHVDAVSTAKLNLIRLCDRDTHPRFKAEIEKRIERLTEVGWWILNGIYHPGLQFSESPKSEDKPEPEKPQDNGPAARPE